MDEPVQRISPEMGKRLHDFEAWVQGEWRVGQIPAWQEILAQALAQGDRRRAYYAATFLRSLGVEVGVGIPPEPPEPPKPPVLVLRRTHRGVVELEVERPEPGDEIIG